MVGLYIADHLSAHDEDRYQPDGRAAHQNCRDGFIDSLSLHPVSDQAWNNVTNSLDTYVANRPAPHLSRQVSKEESY